jgi:bifunctional UDP-N-acetylglucosamine pyrophosphorylase/glucosamine-1-phosphate N-acetyltransferase
MGAIEPPHIVVLAGGAGARMRVGHPKALHPVFFRPMIHYALDAATAAAHRSITLVVGPGERELREQCRGYPGLRVVRAEAETPPEPGGGFLIVAGDCPLLSARTLDALAARHAASGAERTSARAAGAGAAAVAWCSRTRELSAPEGAAEYPIDDPLEALAVDDLYGLWRVETALQERFNRELMSNGTSLQDPRTTLIDPRCRIGADVRIEGGCTVINSVLGTGARLEGFCRISDSEIGAGTRLLQGTRAERARVGRDCRVGPYAHLRPGTRLEDDVWVGNFAELKDASLGSGTRATHQCYLGDARIGRKVTIGCGFITSSASARPREAKTVIEDEAFIGGASQAIAPVTVGAGSFVATGTSITEDAPADSFVISRGRQVTKPGYSRKYGKAKDPGAPR